MASRPGALYLDEEPGEESGITDPWLKKISLYKLQKYTRPALRALELTPHQLARRVELPAARLQELLDGEKPTTQEIQLLRKQLGPDFNPTSILKKRIRMEPIDLTMCRPNWTPLLQRLMCLESRMEKFEEMAEKVTRLEASSSTSCRRWTRPSSCSSPDANRAVIPGHGDPARSRIELNQAISIQRVDHELA